MRRLLIAAAGFCLRLRKSPRHHVRQRNIYTGDNGKRVQKFKPTNGAPQ
jgi:hypothetical protein